MQESDRDSGVSLYQKLVVERDQRHHELDRLAQELETKGWLGRHTMFRASPDLRGHLKFRECQQSILDARESAPLNEGQIVIF